MEDAKVQEHISELYLKCEHLKREIKRDREDMYEEVMRQNKALRTQNELLREELKSARELKELVSYAQDFVKFVSKFAAGTKKGKVK